MPLTHILLEHPSQLLEDKVHGFFQVEDLFKDRIRFCSASPFFWRWLSLGLTEKSGVLMGISKIAPDALFRLLAESMEGGPTKPIPFQDELQMLVMDVLEEICGKRNDPKIQKSFSEILGYFEEGESAERHDAKRYALSRDLAAGFYRYAFDAPEASEKWLASPKDLAHPDSLWQSELWRMTFALGQNRFVSPADAMSHLSKKTIFCNTPGRIVVWGHAFLAPALQKLLLYYSRSPGAEVVQIGLQNVEGPGREWFCAEEAGRIRARALGFPEPVLIARKKTHSFPANSIHGELRTIFLNGGVSKEIKISDRSQMDFSIQAGHDKRRQAEILQNLVIAILERHKDWSPRDIGILAPKSSDWFAYLKGVFKRDLGFPAGHIPVAFAGLDVADESAAHSAWNGFLNLTDRRYSRSAVLEILENPCVRAALKIDENEAAHWADLLEKSGASWGIDAAHRAELGAGEDPFNTFAEARRRILGGMLFGGEGPGRIAEEDSSRLEQGGALLG
ncbi:MAG: exodeoxyribonuclease V subunit gamma, partial [Spirochaetia bacterium]|nr:exodeoxyribonuclease V subunit gamma [Spirochaetia bacterium]